MSWRVGRRDLFPAKFYPGSEKDSGRIVAMTGQRGHRVSKLTRTCTSPHLTASEEIPYTLFMNAEYTAVLRQDGDWWIGWIEEIPGVNCQELTKADLRTSLREVLAEAVEFKTES